jgi:protein-tyrosine phosphatase
LRSDSISALTTRDIAYLKKYEVTRIIDLRSEKEIALQPDPVIEGVTYQNVPLLTGEVGDATHDFSSMAHLFMGDFYLDFVEQGKAQIKEVFETIAEADGCILFHCAAGKDRTGVIAALLLSLAEVAKEDIIANYQTTYTYLKANPIFSKAHADFPREMIYSAPSYIKRVLDYIEEKYQDTFHFLLATGLSETQLTQIRARFVQSPSFLY